MKKFKVGDLVCLDDVTWRMYRATCKRTRIKPVGLFVKVCEPNEAGLTGVALVHWLIQQNNTNIGQYCMLRCLELVK
jgi:hypothetical protein